MQKTYFLTTNSRDFLKKSGRRKMDVLRPIFLLPYSIVTLQKQANEKSD
ncbi:hypothetical protein SAMN05216518_12826 [Bacteroidales bacterium KHT7]|nr:hypothetical protein SAMN05216518_12826 [Bacteroidales bacterium KHT7]